MCTIDNRLKDDFMQAFLIVDSYVPKKLQTSIEKIYVSNQMTRSLGICKTRRYRSNGNMTSEIGISSRLLNDSYPKDYRVGTLIHEILHAYFPTEHHGGNWLKYAEIISKYTEYNIQRLATEEEHNILNELDKETAKYQYKCLRCGTIMSSNRATKWIKTPQYFRCSKCGGGIIRIK